MNSRGVANGGKSVDESEYTTYPLGSTVYAIQTAPGRVKLGYTQDLSRRMSDIEGMAGEATLLRYEAAGRAYERRLHHACREHHLTREFFANEGAVAGYVAGNFSVLDLGPAPAEAERSCEAESIREAERMAERMRLIGTPTRSASHARTCQHCHKPLYCIARSDARFCSVRCRVAAHRATRPMYG